MTEFSRRDLLLTSAGLSGAALAGAARSASPRPLDLEDPAIALEAYIKLRGSTARETVYQQYEGDIYLVTEGEVAVPAVGFRGIQKSHWYPHPRGGYGNQDYDLGVYVDYETREVLSHWDNPLTDDTVEVVHYRGGPSGSHFQVGRSAGDVYGDVEGRWRVAGNQLWHTASRWGSRRNPLQPDEWPKSSSGELILGSMSLSFAGRVDEVRNPDLPMVPAMQIWTNTVSWMPWMEMGQRPGFNMWRWVGAKGVDREELDPQLVTAVEQIWPGYVTKDAVWKEPTSGRRDYARLKKAKPLTR
ncbi:MAG: hypothetical protein ACI87W_003380 [Halieaceae bacterium]|jgi:hypothetical protein